MLRDINIMPDENRSSRKLAVITGATSGIGREYACYFASNGYDLIISGRRKELISKLAQELENTYNIRAEVVIADLSKTEDLARLLKAVCLHDNIEVLINNAGYGLDSSFSSDNLSRQMDMLKVHVNAPLTLIHKVLPVMINNRRGIIINVSSLGAWLPTSGNAMYTGTKSFLKNFTESLHMDVSGYGIKVQCLCPGLTYSDFHRNNYRLKVNAKPLFWMKPEQVVSYSIHSLKKGQVICIPGYMYRVMRSLVILLPRWLYYLLVRKLDKSLNRPVLSGKVADFA